MAGVGGRAIERLLDEISNGALPPGTEIITPELVMRGSTLPGE
jgi:DNA-binding LacI/PurR family transcriptional regulator